jgi:hypothetical protein
MRFGPSVETHFPRPPPSNFRLDEISRLLRQIPVSHLKFPDSISQGIFR